MDRENALSTIASFDTELYTFFQEEVQRQKYTLSFMPEENYSSPLSTYLEGSILSEIKKYKESNLQKKEG